MGQYIQMTRTYLVLATVFCGAQIRLGTGWRQ